MTDDLDNRGGVIVPDVAEPIVAYRMWPVYTVPTVVPDPVPSMVAFGDPPPLPATPVMPSSVVALRYLTAARTNKIVWLPAHDETAQCLAERVIDHHGRNPVRVIEERFGHEVPSLWPALSYVHEDGYGCGIYAFATLGDAIEAAVPTGLRMQRMIGRVLLWGRCIGHEHGWRAQHARITALYRTPLEWSYLRDGEQLHLADRYEVPLLDLPDMVHVQRHTSSLFAGIPGLRVVTTPPSPPLTATMELAELLSAIPRRLVDRLERIVKVLNRWDRLRERVAAPWRRYPRAVPLALGLVLFAAVALIGRRS